MRKKICKIHILDTDFFRFILGLQFKLKEINRREYRTFGTARYLQT